MDCYLCFVKKFLVAAILVFYSIATFGVSINYFYCCGKLKTVSLTSKAGDETYKSKSTNGCAKNLTVTIKLRTDQRSNDQTKFHVTAPVAPAIIHTDNYNLSFVIIPDNVNQLYNRPPPYNLPSRQIRYCVFRI